MTKIIIAGAGGAPSEGVINSLLRSNKKETIIGIGSEPTDLVLSNAHEKYYVPYANTPHYKDALLTILKTLKPDLIHFQNDLEIFHASLFRDEIEKCGVKLFMPSHDVIDTCVHKYKSYLKFKEAGIKVPKNILINNEEDLKEAFQILSNEKGMIWLRDASIGAGGKGALPTNNYYLAKNWIDHFTGWGNYVAAEILSPNSVTWMSLWYEGELIVAQTRIRKGWTHGNRAISGITGVTKVGQTYSNREVDEVAINTIKSVTKKPHGIFGVDMTYDFCNIPNPTEINISRFFTTVLFFTEAGLNMPLIFKDIALYNEFPKFNKIINPLPDNLLWLRGMDIKPKLTTEVEINNSIKNL
jgi:carbamoyl-phosphate synthase large subunit